MLVEIFCQIDDFCKFFEKEANIKLIGSEKKVGRTRQLTTSEILTIIVYFHASGFKNFKTYYETMIRGYLRTDFSGSISYNRFIELRQESMFLLMLFVKIKGLGLCDGISIIDSCKLEVCNVRREYSHKVFKGIAAKGKTSTGWFYGFKLHLIINSQGEIISIFITPGNVADNNPEMLEKITQGIYGKMLGDKGYIGAFEQLYEKGIHLIHRIRSNMKNKLVNMYDKLLLRKRGVVESVIDILKDEYSLQSTKLRSMTAFVAHVCSAVIAYSLRPNKPSIFRTKMLISID